MSVIRALVVDDSQAMRRSLVHALSKMGGEVVCTEAQDGAEGFKKLSQAAFDIVLTDINMPLVDGLKLISLIRQQPARHRLPIVVITTEGAVEDRSRAMNLGANAYLVKPVLAQQVVDTVRELLSAQPAKE